MEYNVQAPNGEMHVIEGPEGASDSDIIEAAQHLFPGPNALESAGRAFVNNLPLGGQIGGLGTAAITPGEGYSEGLEEWNKKAAEAKAAHPVAYGVGAVGGAIAPALVPGAGELGVLGNAALGAGYGIGNIDVTKQPEEAAKQAALGAVIGGGIGALAPTGEGAAESLEGFANRKAVQGLGLKPGTLGIPKSELEDLGQFASEAGLTQGSLEARVGQAQDLLGQVGAQIGENGVGATLLNDNAPFIEQLHNHLQESANIFGPEANAETSIYRQALANLSKPNISFDELQGLKTAIGKRAFDGLGEVKNEAAADVYMIYKDAMKSIISGSPTEYQETMHTYGKLKDIHDALTNQWQTEQARGIQAKGFGMAGKMGGLVMGGNVPATVAASAALGVSHPFLGMGLATTLVNNPQAMESGARGLAGIIPKLATIEKTAAIGGTTSSLLNRLHTNPQSFGKFAKPLLRAAQEGGNNGLSAASFVMAHQYPEYNELLLHGAEHTAIEHANEHIGEEEH